MELENKNDKNNHQENSSQQEFSQSTLSALPSWIGVLSEISPVLSGVASFGGFINSVISARETAAFQQDLLSTLQSIQFTINSIAADLTGIEATLQALATELEGLALSDKITAIGSWGMSLSALSTDMTDSTNLQTAQILAASMMDADNAATNLLGSMLGIHNAMVGGGGNLSSPLIAQITPEAFFQLRGRLIQGLHLLAFATAFNPSQFDYGNFLLSWSNNFQAQTQCYLEYKLDNMVPMASELVTGGFNYNQTSSDGIVQYAYLQPNVPNVTLRATMNDGGQLPVWTDTLTVAPATSTTPLQAVTMTGQGFARVDIYKKTITFEASCPIAEEKFSTEALSEGDTPLFYFCDWYELSSCYNRTYNVYQQQTVNLECGARWTPGQTFLGGCNGQILWVEQGKDLLVAIIEGTDLTGNVLTYDASTQTLGSTPFAALTTLTGALWIVSYADPICVSIQPQIQGSSNLYLTQDVDGNKSLVSEATTLLVVASPATPGTRGNPFNMPPVSSSMSKNLSCAAINTLFYQF